MKLATFDIERTGRRTVGARRDGCYVDLAGLSGGGLPADMIAFLKAGDAAMEQARALLAGLPPEVDAAHDHVYGEAEIVLQAPVPLPGKIVHTSCNFDTHLQELTTWKDPEWESHNWGDFHFEHPTGTSFHSLLGCCYSSHLHTDSIDLATISLARYARESMEMSM